MSNFNMFYGERVRNVGQDPGYRDKEGVVVGGDEHNFVIKWDDVEDEKDHDPCDILWLVKERKL